MSVPPELSFAGWLVLALVDEQPRHGYAIAALAAEDGELAAVWTANRPDVYRALDQLGELALVELVGDGAGRGARRRLLSTTLAGRLAVGEWLHRPVMDVGDIRPELLVKLALLDRRGLDDWALLHVQHARLAPLAARVQARLDASRGFDRVLALWHAETLSAVLRFLDDLVT